MRSPDPRVAPGLGWAPSIDLAETDDAFVLTAEVPGVEPKSIDVRIEDQSLLIKGEKPHEWSEEAEDMSMYERDYGPFRRSITLPRSIDLEEVEATIAHGVLTVSLPKGRSSRGRRIDVTGPSEE